MGNLTSLTFRAHFGVATMASSMHDMNDTQVTTSSLYYLKCEELCSFMRDKIQVLSCDERCCAVLEEIILVITCK